MTKNQTKSENSAGGVVFYLNKEKLPYFLLIKDRFHKWTIPKGHIENSETAVGAAQREIFEETGVLVSGAISELGDVEFIFKNDKNENVKKNVKLFLFPVSSKEFDKSKPNLKEAEELKWLNYEEAVNMLDYANIKFFFKKAQEIIGN